MRLLCLLLLVCGLQARAAPVTVYTNASAAPLLTADGRGLYPDVLAWLTRQLPDLQFQLVYLPRKRMQVLLEAGQLDGLIIGFMPQWLGDPRREKYLWTDAFHSDSFVLASLRPGWPAPGTRIGVTLGYVYPGIDEWIAAHGLLRSEAPSEDKNIEKLVLGRVESVVVAGSVLRHFQRTHAAMPPVHLQFLPGQRTERRLLVPRALAPLYQRLAPVVARMGQDPDWLRLRAQYQ